MEFTFNYSGSESDAAIIKKKNLFYTEAMLNNDTYQAEAALDTQFYLGNQSSYNRFYNKSKKAEYKANRIRRIINMISGHQRLYRKSTIATPVENGDQITADQFSKILMWINDQEGLDFTLSDSFESSLISGLSLVQLYIDYRYDPISGDIKFEHCPYNTFVIDPFFKKADLSDCNAILKRNYVTKFEAATLVPDRRDEILEMNSRTAFDGKFNFTAEANTFNAKDLIAYDEFYYKSYRNRKLLYDTKTGETFDWRFSDKDDRLALFLQTYPEVTISEGYVPTVDLAIFVNDNLVYNGPQTTGLTTMPFVPVFGYFCPQAQEFDQKIQSVVRNLRDVQQLYNHRKTIELAILESQVSSGWIYKEDSLVNTGDVYEQVGTGRGIAIKKGAQMTDVQQIMAPQIPPSMLQVSEIMGKEIMEISGIGEESLGMATDGNVAGILAKMRQGAGLVMLQGLFDRLDLSQKLCGRLELEAIQVNYMPGKIKNILDNEDPSPQFYSKAFGRYDVMIEEGHNTTTQRQAQLAEMLMLKQAGVIIPDESLIEASAIQNKTRIIELIKQQQEGQQQAQQMQIQVQMQEAQARAELSSARAMADRGLGLERVSRVEENEASAEERKAEAVSDRNQATLNLVKAMKEIDEIDLNQLQKIISMMNVIKAQEADVNKSIDQAQMGPEAPQPQMEQPMKKRRNRKSLNSNVTEMI